MNHLVVAFNQQFLWAVADANLELGIHQFTSVSPGSKRAAIVYCLIKTKHIAVA